MKNTREVVLKRLSEQNLRYLPHIFIPSYNRPNFISAKLFEGWDDDLLKKVHIVVRPEQYTAYKKANPKLDILKLTGKINGLASTRQWIFDYAVENRYGVIVDMDDDIKHLRFMYEGFSGRGNATTKHSLIGDLNDDCLLNARILALATGLSREIFRKHPNIVLGNLHRQKACFNVKYGKLKYIINSEVTPRQVTIMNVKKIYSMKIKRDMIFDPHGDDIGFVAVLMKHGLGCFNIPCLGYEYLSEKCDSVVRTPENAKRLHKYEHDMLMTYPIKDYLRHTFLDEDGNPMWNDVDWRKYHKVHNSKLIRVYWDGTTEGLE